MSDPALNALAPGAHAALLAGNRRLAIALLRQATGLDQDAAAALIARHDRSSAAREAPRLRLDRLGVGCAALAGVVAATLYFVLTT